MNKLPHVGVYVRLKPSRIHGVGVFAIRDIPKGTAVFGGDNGRMKWIKASEVKRLKGPIKKLYTDFCVLRKGKYGCPKNFNALTVAWYINHSKKPNMIADRQYNFYSARKIRKGEELTLDYDSYSYK